LPRLVTIPFVTVMQGTKFPEQPALPVTGLSVLFNAPVTIPLVIVRAATFWFVAPKVPVTPEYTDPDDPEQEVEDEGIITKRARPD